MPKIPVQLHDNDTESAELMVDSLAPQASEAAVSDYTTETDCPYVLFDSLSSLVAMLDQMYICLWEWVGRESIDHHVFLDFEGIELGPTGEIVFGQFVTKGFEKPFIIDIQVLERSHPSSTFLTKSGNGALTLKDILEDKTVIKAFWDLRMDSAALFAEYSIRLRNVIDVQLMELLTRKELEMRRLGLASAIEHHLTKLPLVERQKNANTRRGGSRFFANDYALLQQRNPKPARAVLDYCATDVMCLHSLYEHYKEQLSDQSMKQALEASTVSLEKTQSNDFKVENRYRAQLHPWAKKKKR